MENFIKYIVGIALIFLVFPGCKEDEGTLNPLTAPSELKVKTDISKDGSGVVSFSASAENALTYHYFFGISDTEKQTLSNSGEITYVYKASGKYDVRVVAYAAGGVASSTLVEVSVEVTYAPPAEVIEILTKGSSRNWVWKASAPGHLGVGPAIKDGEPSSNPEYYAAAPFDKESIGCLYDDVLTFTLSNGAVVLNHNNKGQTYFNAGTVNEALGIANPNEDTCYEFDTSGDLVLGFFQAGSGLENSTGVGFEVNGGFLSYYVGNNTYEILSISEQELHVRVLMGSDLAWYQKFIAEDAEEENPDGGSDDVSIPTTGYTTPESYDGMSLVWQDEFEGEELSPDNWTFETGTGENGWGNNELQYYKEENTSVQDGYLIITAKKEAYEGREYTSSRIVTQGKQSFKYGRVDIRAALPQGQGIWPALWMLGESLSTVSWPASGEIDIMEMIGGEGKDNQVHGTVHWDEAGQHASYGQGATLEEGVFADEFHVFSIVWDENKITWYLDDVQFNVIDITPENLSEFHEEFFFIFNVAVGGNWPGAPDNSTQFPQSMIVDYVRVFQ